MIKVLKPYLFPLCFAFNSFSLSFLLVVAGLAGQSALAADLSLSQAAMLTFFFSLSGNARNLILKSRDEGIDRSIMQMRLLTAPLLAVAALAVSVYVSKVSIALSAALVLRQLSEWFTETELSRRESNSEHAKAELFLASLALPLFGAVASLLFFKPIFLPMLYVWAVLPLLLCAGGLVRYAATLSRISIEWRRILPNCGSTFIIGMGVFFFRQLITGFSGKEAAGQLFTAFALGSIAGSLYDRTIGPSLNISGELEGARRLISRVSWSLPLVGAAIVLAAYFFGDRGYISRNLYLVPAAGFSLAGGFVMIGAQAIKINLLHSKTRNDVFMADLLSNFSILVSVPVTYLVFGEAAFSALYFTNAVLVYLAYWLMRGEFLEAKVPSFEKLLQGAAAFAVLAPIFLQLGGGIYRAQAELYDWGGKLSMMPLPLSAFLIFPLILLLHSFRGVKRFAVFTFAVFSIMMFGTVISSPHDPEAIKDKLLLSMQYILPFFGLVLAEHVGLSKEFERRMARGFLYLSAAIVVLQTGIALLSGGLRLSPYLYAFSIYNNSQYAAVIFVSAFLVSLFWLYDTAGRKERKLLLLMFPLMCLYAAMSWSMLAIVMILTGLLIFWISSRFERRIGLFFMAGVAAVFLLGGVLRHYGGTFSLMKEGAYPTISALKIRQCAMAVPNAPPATPAGRAGTIPPNVSERLGVWSFYAGRVRDADLKTLLFGHSVVLHRKQYPSAHNYYLDILYNFGLLTLLPIILLVLYTVKLVWAARGSIAGDSSLLGVVFVVLFLVFLENSFKVGLRQPYSGIYSFFLWGLLAVKLKALCGASPGKPS